MDFKSGEETVGWFRDRYIEGSLTIQPPYQRKPVWMARQKCYLIESALLSLPIPEVFVQRDTDEHGSTSYALVDGQQRIRSMLQFAGSETDADQLEYNEFALDKLDPDSDWYGLTFSKLSSSDRKNFFGYRLAVRFIDTSDEFELKALFRRLNRYTVPLKPQELRNATYEGPFAKLAEKLAEDYADILAENRIVTVGSIRRMGDVELMAELLIGVLHGPQGGSAAAIDQYYGEYEDFESEFPGQRRVRRTFDATMSTISETLDDLRDSRWSNKSDFYSLFVATATFLRAGLAPRNVRVLAKTLVAFAEEVDQLMTAPGARASKEVARYVRNVQRGANDKTRRAERHASLSAVLQPLFK